MDATPSTGSDSFGSRSIRIRAIVSKGQDPRGAGLDCLRRHGNFMNDGVPK